MCSKIKCNKYKTLIYSGNCTAQVFVAVATLWLVRAVQYRQYNAILWWCVIGMCTVMLAGYYISPVLWCTYLLYHYPILLFISSITYYPLLLQFSIVDRFFIIMWASGQISPHTFLFFSVSAVILRQFLLSCYDDGARSPAVTWAVQWLRVMSNWQVYCFFESKRKREKERTPCRKLIMRDFGINELLGGLINMLKGSEPQLAYSWTLLW